MSVGSGFVGLLRRLAGSRWTQLIVGTIASVALAWLAVRQLRWEEVGDTFQTFPIALALASLVPVGAAMLLRAFRWHVLLVDQDVSFRRVFLTQNTGIGLNNMLPIRMVSEPLQLAIINRRYRVPFPAALATLVGGNVLDIFATALLMGLGVLLVPGLREGEVGIMLAGAFIMFVVSFLVFLVVARGLSAIPIAGKMRFFQRLSIAVTLLRDHPSRLWASFAATLANWLLMGIAGWVLALGLDIPITPLPMASIIVAATFFTSAVPSLPAGTGTFHFAVTGMVTAFGAEPAAAFSFAVVMHLIIVLPPSAIALVMLPRIGYGIVRRASEEAASEEERVASSSVASARSPR